MDQVAAFGGIEITVSEDNLTAFVRGTGDPCSDGTVRKIKELLQSRGICYGMVPDETIEKYLEDLPHQIQPLEVARGEKPMPGQDARIVYYFETDPLKIGTLKHGGIIDYRDRGEIPQVKEGALLARKEPASPGKQGFDVFGTESRPSQAKDIKLRCGKGALKSEDGLRVHATQDGEPTISSDGKISVISKLHIAGDVGLGTGHVHFDGEVDVTGSVQDGFRVLAARLAAGELLRSDITVSGDIMVSGGIIGATIRGDGNLKARYIHQARIHLLGDVVVEKEVIDSDIMTNGAFLLKTGKAFNSRICAKAGIEAQQIGSDESRPCALSVGLDEGARAKIEHLKELKKKRRAKRKKLERVIERLQPLTKEMLKKISEFAQDRDRGTEEPGRERNDPDKRVEKCMVQQERIQTKIEVLEKKVEELKSERNTMDQDIDGIHEWSQSSGGHPFVKVQGTIYAHTIIKAPHTSTELMRNFTRSTIVEKQVTRPDDQREIWKMVAAPLK